MGKFVNTSYANTVDSLVEGFKSKLNNPYYIHSDKVATITEYYRQNIEASTLDEALKIAQAQKGDNSPIRYNKINDFFIYGIEKIEVQLGNDEFGLESSTLEGEGIILPNSIIPIPGDYFMVIYLEKPYVFKVIDVTSDTLESGANFFKIQWKYSSDNNENIEQNVVGEYDMIVNNIGSDYRVVIESSEKDYIIKLEEILLRLKKYYKNLFYNSRVQTFTYQVNDDNFYDPYLIEFLIRNKLLEGDGEFISITHQMHMPQTFAIDYDSTFFRSVELRDIASLNKSLHGNAEYIDQPLSIFYNRMEDYFAVEHIPNSSGTIYDTNSTEFEIFSLDLYEAIEYNYNFSTVTMKDIITKYFNRLIYTSHDLEIFNELEFTQSKELYYNIPILIMCIEEVIKDILNGRMSIPRVDLGVEPTVVTYGTTVISSFSDSIYAYFIGTLTSGSSSNIWIVNRYNKNNEMKIAITYVRPETLQDCQVLTYV